MTQPKFLCGALSPFASWPVLGKPRLSWVVCKPLVVAAVLLAPINALAETAEQLAAAEAETLKIAEENSHLAPSYWPWDSTEAEKPPEIQTYQLPTLAGDGVNYHAKPAPLAKAPALNPDAVYQTVLRCYPEKSHFAIDIALRASVRSSDVLDETDLSSGLGKSYVGIVANMPLYSSQELNREREREYMRRKDTAKAVADFIAAIAGRGNQSMRELALYGSLEARSAIRVQSGIVRLLGKSGNRSGKTGEGRNENHRKPFVAGGDV